MQLNEKQLDRAVGAITASAYGDALGQSYEFGPPLPDDEVVELKSGPVFGLGEWTDDTAQAVAIALAGNAFVLHEDAAWDAIASHFLEWAQGAKDIGIQTRMVFRATEQWNAESMFGAALEVQTARPGSAGNGSLMRTGPVALQYLDNDALLDFAVERISSLTHAEQTCVEACQLWSRAIRHAVLEGNLEGLWLAIERLPADRREFWTTITREAEDNEATSFTPNGWVIRAYQVAWSALSRVPEHSEDPIREALDNCIRVGDDTDTTAAICGSLAGARWGHSRVPVGFEKLHGWPDLVGADLIAIAQQLVSRR